MISKQARVMIAMAGLAVLSVPAFAQTYRPLYSEREGAGELRVRVGDFRPDGDSSYWNGIRHDFTNSDPSDFEGPDVAVDYILPLNGHLGLIFSGSYYEGSSTQSYRGYLDNFNNRIRHDTSLDIASATAGLVFHLTGPDTPVQPYIGAGGGGYSYRLAEHGDFIDFTDPQLAIFHSRLTSSDTAFGYYFLAGLEFPITRRVAIFAEGRWTRVKTDLRDDFDGFGQIDLGGREVAVGLGWSL
jgi:opacity protein-like surface antigen